METITVILKDGRIPISKEVFTELLNIPYIHEFKDYQRAMESGTITIKDLKKLAKKCYVPYPFFFASMTICKKQLADKNRELYQKMATKDEMNLVFRGKMQKEDIELIVLDLGRKQQFLKERVLSNAVDNPFVGIIRKWKTQNMSVEGIAGKINAHFGFNLDEVRLRNKEEVFEYLTRKIEAKNILVSLSSYNYMPQKIPQELELSGLCVKDRKFPYIFLNTRDGDEIPRILESAGRRSSPC